MTIGPTFFHDAPTLPHTLRHESTYRQDLHATTMTMPLIDVVYVSCRIHKIGIAVSPLAIKGQKFTVADLVSYKQINFIKTENAIF